MHLNLGIQTLPSISTLISKRRKGRLSTSTAPQTVLSLPKIEPMPEFRPSLGAPQDESITQAPAGMVPHALQAASNQF